VHGLPVGVVLLNRDYDIQSINAVARRQLGIHSSAAGRDLLHLVRNFSVDELRRAIDRAFSGEPVSDLVLTSEAGPVEPHHALEITCYPVTKTDDSETFAAVVIADVTVREQISRSLRSAEAMVRRLTALNDEVLSANIELTNTIAKLRTDNEELLVASEEVQAATEEVETLNEELQASNEELETLNEELHATVEELNTTNDDLEARAIELQEMAVTIEAERARLESVLNNIGEAVMVIGRTGDILISNPAFQRMFGSDDSGFQPQDESGNPMLPNASPIARAARGETFSLTFTTFHHGIGHRWFEAEGRPVPWYANESAGVVTIRDITDRSLRHLQEQWLSSASHELRTPLTALQVYLQLAVRQFQDTPDSLPGETIGRAIDQSKRIATLIDQIVDAARYQQAPSTVQPREIDLVALVERTVRTANDISGNPRVSIEMPLDKPLLMIEGDPELLQQMIYNVIENAVTFSSPEETVQVQLSLNAGHAEITVGDSGPGIDSSDMPQIFERSIRGNEAGEGLGLGLYVAREIVGQHAGTIDATPSDGPGSAFRIRLPLHRA
jgi:two-component system CheB/CheR fusion protein